MFDGAGHLFFTHGERGHMNDAQDLTRPNGKVHRVFDEGVSRRTTRLSASQTPSLPSGATGIAIHRGWTGIPSPANSGPRNMGRAVAMS
ncbi:MAG: PQQ-dependent sugar dehydrogenase [Verrucomicrobia bacterium]|nr:PQQ-dependent sugar dehydrogenase [Verrucomicrobiota bacterium]